MTVLRLALFAFVIVQVVRALLIARRRQAVLGAVWRRVRWWMWALVPVVLLLVGGTAVLLLPVPGLDWGWGRLLGVDANAFLSPVVAAAEANGPGVRVWLERGGALAFLVVLAYVMPLFTLVEERVFRRGVERGGWRRWARATIAFGLVHLLVGIPVAVALALSWGGVAFALVYRNEYQRVLSATPALSAGRLVAVWPADPGEEACHTAAAFHLAYNITVLAVLAVALVLGI